MLEFVPTGQFRRDMKLMRKQNQDIELLTKVLRLLIEEKPIPRQYKDHPLRNDWKDCRELHIKPDWLLVYIVSDGVLHGVRTGSHSEIFG